MDAADYGMTYELGFIFPNPLDKLPEYFHLWNELKEKFPELVKNKAVRDAVDKLPLLDHKLLKNEAEKLLAHLILSLVTGVYVYQEGDAGVTPVLPKQLSVPLCGISDDLKIQPVVTYPSFVLANWKKIDPAGPLDLKNLEPIMALHPIGPCGWFILVSLDVDLKFVPAVKLIENILEAVKEENTPALIEQVTQLTDVIHAMLDSLKRTGENLTPTQFYNEVRPYLTGWGGSGSALPDGLKYENVHDTPIQLAGGSGAQSTTIQSLDAILGVKHTPEQKKFLLDMRRYMPNGHRRYIEDLNERASLKQYVVTRADDGLTKAFNEANKALTDYRSHHIIVVTRFVVNPSKSNEKNEFDSLKDRGTGGTTIIPFLKSVRDATEKNKV